MPQTQTIIDGLGVDGIPIDDINIIVQLKRGWQFAINEKMLLDLNFEKRLNAIVARNTAAFKDICVMVQAGWKRIEASLNHL